MRIADSLGFIGGTPLPAISALFAASPQLSLYEIVAPAALCNSRVGSSICPVNGSEGPIARMITFFASVPVTINPAIKTSVPVPTTARVEMLARVGGPLPGIGVGVDDGVGVGVADPFTT